MTSSSMSEMLLPPSAAACAEIGRRRMLNTAEVSCAKVARDRHNIVRNKYALFFTFSKFNKVGILPTFAKIVQAERNTKKAGFFLLPRRRLSYLKIVQAERRTK